jgi:transketolase
MRKAFVETVIELAARDDRVVLLTADIGYNALEPFGAKFPRRFFNVGVAEQNMIALATGLAEAGLRPYCYSIATFAALRPYEFIRNGPILHQLPVRIVGMGGGLEYGPNGSSHHAIDDVGVLRVQTGLSIFVPADSRQTRTILDQTSALPGPVYYRLEKDESLVVPGLEGRFRIGQPEPLIQGRDLLFVVTGGITSEVIAAAEQLTRKNVSAGVAVVSSLSTIDRSAFADLIDGYRLIITVEAHSIQGGLGSMIAEVIAETQTSARLIRSGVTTPSDGLVGDRSFLYERHGLGRVQLVAQALAALRNPAVNSL